MGRIECGGGEGGEPVLSPPGWKSYACWMHLTLGERAWWSDVPEWARPTKLAPARHG